MVQFSGLRPFGKVLLGDCKGTKRKRCPGTNWLRRPATSAVIGSTTIKAAKALGLIIPPGLLAIADEVIE
jgi:hypothetical protein